MREDLDRLLRDVTLATLALAVATGWSLYQLVHGVATLTLDGAVGGAIELGLVLLAAHWIARRRQA